jgi:hypothetical protein
MFTDRRDVVPKVQGESAVLQQSLNGTRKYILLTTTPVPLEINEICQWRASEWGGILAAGVSVRKYHHSPVAGGGHRMEQSDGFRVST